MAESVVAAALSPRVEVAVNRAIELSTRLVALHPTTCSKDGRVDITVRYVGLCLDHREAIILLVRHGARSSAYALARSVYEACMRGLWVQTVAREDQIRRLVEEGVLPKFETMIQQLNKLEGLDAAAVKALSWSMLSDWSHGGVLQLGNWHADDVIGPAHPDEEMVNILTMTNTWVLLAMDALLSATGAGPDDKLALAALFRRVCEEG
jgi:hypothetical protein